ncbi:MAG TPA: glycosyltransferase family 39 protein, partial [Vicinamibacteria bacterium]|nr:glycosyltransferase family 39 protein [Vicinamibacteria bacterium]
MQWRAVLLIAAAAVAVRLAYVVDGTLGGWMELGDALHYHETATRIASGRGLPFTAHWVPLYPLALSPFYRLFGDSWLVPRMVNAWLGGVTAALLMHWTARAFDRRSAPWAGALYAAFPTAIAYSGHVASENLAVPLALAACLALGRLLDRTRLWTAALLGTLFGLLALTRADGAVLFVLTLLWLLCRWRRRGGQAVAAVAVAAAAWAVVLAPWTVRNHQVFGRFIPLTTSAGPTLLDGNNPLAAGGPVGLEAYPPAWRGVGGPRETERNTATRRLALQWMRGQGIGLAGHLGRKLATLWSPRTAFFFRAPTRYPRLQKWVLPVFFPLVLAAGWVGALLAPWREARAALWLVFVQVHLIALVFFG